jgi:hypothetical protein
MNLSDDNTNYFSLQNITTENFDKIIKLDPNSEHMTPNIYSIAECLIMDKNKLFVNGIYYIDELIGTDHNGKEIIDYHIRMKGVSNSTLEYELKQEIKKENPCYENMLQMYMHLYEGNSIDFDLTEGMGKSRFKISKSFGVETIDKFSRQIKFIV